MGSEKVILSASFPSRREPRSVPRAGKKARGRSGPLPGEHRWTDYIVLDEKDRVPGRGETYARVSLIASEKDRVIEREVLPARPGRENRLRPLPFPGEVVVRPRVKTKPPRKDARSMVREKTMRTVFVPTASVPDAGSIETR
jgi:hypothetical protein